MKQLSLTDFANAFKSRKVRTKFVPLPELAPEGSEKPEEHGVWVLAMSLEEKDAFEKHLALEAQKLRLKDGINAFRARYIARFICGEDGARLGNDSNWELYAKLDSAPMTRIFEAGWKLNGYADNDLLDMVDSLKNAPTGDPGSA